MIYQFVKILEITKVKNNIRNYYKDKYKNINKKQGYKEDEILGGYEPYGASKASVEILYHSYFQSFYKFKSNIFTPQQEQEM